MARPPNPDAPLRLLAAARASFASVGVDQARIADIAEAAGFSKATFYLYFESKEAVFERLVNALFTASLAIVVEARTAQEALVAEIGACTAEDWAQQSPRLLRFREHDRQVSERTLATLWDWRDVFACIEQASGARRLVFDQLLEGTRQTVTAQLHQAVALGMLRPELDAELVSEMLIGVYLQLARRMARLDARPDLSLWSRQIEAFLSSGIHGAAAPTPASPRVSGADTVTT
jgi:AcrR family transcriptional regulator